MLSPKSFLFGLCFPSSVFVIYLWFISFKNWPRCSMRICEPLPLLSTTVCVWKTWPAPWRLRNKSVCVFFGSALISFYRPKQSMSNEKRKIEELFIGLGSQTLPRELRPFVQFFVLISWGISMSFSQPAPMHIPQCSHNDYFFKCILCTALRTPYRYNKFDSNLQKQLNDLLWWHVANVYCGAKSEPKAVLILFQDPRERQRGMLEVKLSERVIRGHKHECVFTSVWERRSMGMCGDYLNQLETHSESNSS